MEETAAQASAWIAAHADIHRPALWAGIALVVGFCELLAPSGWLLGLALGAGALAGALKLADATDSATWLTEGGWTTVLLIWGVLSTMAIVTIRKILASRQGGTDINDYERGISS